MAIEALTTIHSIEPLRGKMAEQASEADSGAFAQKLEAAMESTNSALVDADKAATALATGEGIGLHETMIAMERADIAFRTFTAVKNKAVAAYQEISRMQI